MAPMFEKAATLLEPDIRLLKLNVDEAPDIATRYSVRSIPALLLFQAGKVLAQSAGAQSAEAITRWARGQLTTA
jgi:thioredoxin 2